MAATNKDKVLVFGSNSTPTASVKALLTKIVALNQKAGPFSCVICLGDFFPPAAAAGQDDGDVQALLDGRLAVPVPTYFSMGSHDLPPKIKEKLQKNAGEVCENLTYLGRQSVLTLSSGLKIGAFGGRFSLESFTSDSTALTNPEYSQASLESFISQPSTSNLDILLLNSWPSQLTRFSEKPITSFSKEQVSSWSVPAINKLLMKAKPKYAFVSSQNLFWEREPFVYPAPSRDQASSAASMMQEQQQHATRFLSLGHFANAAKERNFYAFSIAPGPVMELPPNVTPCPFEDSSSQRGKKRALPDAAEEDGGGNSYIFAGVENARTSANGQRKHGEPPASYKCKICGIPGHFIQDCPEKVDKAPKANNGKPGPPPDHYVCRLCNQPGHWIQDCPMAGQNSIEKRPRRDNGPPKEIAPDECWFCLSNPKVTKHLIASIGSEAYLTLPKGQLLDTSDSTKALVPGGGHCLIIPIAHYPTFSAIPEELASPMQAEIQAYMRALRSCYESYGAKLLAFEVSRAAVGGGKAGHAHIQVLPIPASLAKNARQAFVEEGKKAGYDFVSDSEGSVEAILKAGNYLKVDLPDGEKLVHEIKPGARFSLQFGRATAALLLNDPARSDWKVCAKSDEEEAKDAQAFKGAFAKWDPSG